MYDVNELRLKRMRTLVVQWGTQKDFADAVDLAPAYINQMLVGRRRIGEKTARKIEGALRLPCGWLEQREETAAEINNSETEQEATQIRGTTVVAWETLADLPEGVYVHVTHYKVALSAGSGCEWVEATDSEPLVFRAKWFANRKLRPEMCKALYVRGESMEPTLRDGDTVLIDTSATTVHDDNIYAVLYRGESYIKRLFRLPGGGIEMRSDNPRHPSPRVENADLEQFIVLGQQVWRAG